MVLFEPPLTIKLRRDSELRDMLFESTGRKFVVSNAPDLVVGDGADADGEVRV